MLRREQFDALTSQVGAANLLEALTIEEILSLGNKVLTMGAKILLLKLGTRGLYLRSGDQLCDLGRGAPPYLPAWTGRQLWVPCFQPDRVVSTVGTGDAAIAGFLAAFSVLLFIDRFISSNTKLFAYQNLLWRIH